MNRKPFVTTELKPLPDAVQELIAERDEWKARCEFSFEQRDKLTKERDAYEKCADTMAAAHKVERDALKAELARPESTAVSLMRAENAALKDAARLASRALHRIDAADIRLDTGERLSITKAIAALKAVI